MNYRTLCSVLILAAAVLVGPANLSASGTASVTDMAGKATSMMEKINLNTASVDALSQIPGVGDKIGEAIAAYREANGAFKSIGDLVNVEGIDAALVEKITPFLTL